MTVDDENVHFVLNKKSIPICIVGWHDTCLVLIWTCYPSYENNERLNCSALKSEKANASQKRHMSA